MSNSPSPSARPARFYNLLFAPVLSRPHPPLTAAHWRDIFRYAESLRSPWHGLRFGLSLSLLSLLTGFLSLLGLFSILPVPMISDFVALLATLILSFFLTFLLRPLLSLLVWRLLHQRELRAAANELGFTEVCIHCGYDCRTLKRPPAPSFPPSASSPSSASPALSASPDSSRPRTPILCPECGQPDTEVIWGPIAQRIGPAAVCVLFYLLLLACCLLNELRGVALPIR